MGTVMTATTSDHGHLLRRTLQVDAAVCGLSALLLIALAGEFADPLGLSSALLRGAGFVLIPCAVVLALVGTRATISRVAVRAIVALNLTWAAAGIVLLLLGEIAPTSLGAVFVVAQAILVAGLADLELIGLRRPA
jgi:hypothetical protein